MVVCRLGLDVTGAIEMVARWLAACGIVIPVADIMVTTGLAALDADYSHARQYISELGEDGRPYAALFNAWCVVYGLLFGGFAFGLGRGLGSWPVLVAMLAVAAASVAGAVFPCDFGCAMQTPTAQVHLLTGYVNIAGIVAAPFLSWAAMRGQPAWQRYKGFSLAAAILLLIATGFLAVDYYGYAGRGPRWCPVGVTQRALLGIQYGWMIAVAGRLWVLAGGVQPTATARPEPGAAPGGGPVL